MYQHILKSRRILAILLVAVLALVQVKVAIAGCLVADAGTPVVAVMGDCEECDTGNSGDTFDTLSKICSNHCLQSYVAPAKIPAQPVPAAITVALADTATAPPLILPPEFATHPGKIRLIYRFQRLLI